MALPFFVDQWYLWSNGELRTRRFNCTTLDEANGRMAMLQNERSTTRVRISKRGIKRSNPTTVKVWQKDPACKGPGSDSP